MRHLLLLGLVIAVWADVATLNPVGDVYIISFGGGEGCNTFLKFDISSVPSGADIDSVFLECYVWEVVANWNGDMNFWNVNSQTWQENDSAKIIWNIPTSDSTHQSSGFGTAVGWARSVDLKNIFNRDYQASNTFCSIKMKDPDDPTFVVPYDEMPFDSNDTLDVGFRYNGEIYFYPREHGADIPKLVVFYTPSGVEEEISGKADRPAIPTIITGPLHLPRGKNGRVFDISGREVGPSQLGPGIYFVEVEGRIEQKVIKVR